MTDQIRPFDGQALTYTMRETCAPDAEYQSQFYDADDAAAGFLRACTEVHSVELRDPAGTVIAAFARGCA